MSYCGQCNLECICRKCVKDCVCTGKPFKEKRECSDFLDLFDYIAQEDEKEAVENGGD